LVVIVMMSIVVGSIIYYLSSSHIISVMSPAREQKRETEVRDRERRER
jgi:hypothetical protein